MIATQLLNLNCNRIRREGGRKREGEGREGNWEGEGDETGNKHGDSLYLLAQKKQVFITSYH